MGILQVHILHSEAYVRVEFIKILFAVILSFRLQCILILLKVRTILRSSMSQI